MRRDGFVSVDAGYHFSNSVQGLPQFVAKEPLTIPTTCDGVLRLRVNFVSSVAGYVLVGLELPDESSKQNLQTGFRVSDANKLVGNSVNAVAKWRGNTTSIDDLAGMTVMVRVAMVDARLFSVKMTCEPKV